MADTNYNVKVTVDVQGKKVMDELAKGSKGISPGSASGREGIGSVFQSLIGVITPLTAIISVGVGLLTMGLANSKVLAKMMSTVGKLLGFMVDIILLPLMPLFMGLMRIVWQLIFALRKFIKDIGGEGGTLTFLVDIVSIANPFMWPVLLVQKWIKGESLDGDINYGINIFSDLTGWLLSFIKWMFGEWETLKTQLDFVINFAEGALYSFALWLWGIFSDPAGSAIRLVINIDSNIKEIYDMWLAMTGKSITFTGAGGTGGGGAGGRTTNISTSSTSQASQRSGNVFVNITGQFKSDEEMYQKFITRLRQAWGTSIIS